MKISFPFRELPIWHCSSCKQDICSSCAIDRKTSPYEEVMREILEKIQLDGIVLWNNIVLEETILDNGIKLKIDLVLRLKDMSATLMEI